MFDGENGFFFQPKQGSSMGSRSIKPVPNTLGLEVFGSNKNTPNLRRYDWKTREMREDITQEDPLCLLGKGHGRSSAATHGSAVRGP